MLYGPTSEVFSFETGKLPVHCPVQVGTGLGYRILYGDEYDWSGPLPASRAAAAITGLNVEPGW